MGGSARQVAVAGALVYALTGVVWGSKNSGLFGLARDNGGLQVWLGVGAGLLVLGFASAGWGRRLWRSRPLGPAAAVALAAGALLNVVSAVVDFAILGTLGLAVGLVLLAVVALRERLVGPLDGGLLVVSAVLALTWNTETVSAWLLAVNGAVWVVLSLRLLSVGRPWGQSAPVL